MSGGILRVPVERTNLQAYFRLDFKRKFPFYIKMNVWFWILDRLVVRRVSSDSPRVA